MYVFSLQLLKFQAKWPALKIPNSIQFISQEIITKKRVVLVIWLLAIFGQASYIGNADPWRKSDIGKMAVWNDWRRASLKKQIDSLQKQL